MHPNKCTHMHKQSYFSKEVVFYWLHLKINALMR